MNPLYFLIVLIILTALLGYFLIIGGLHIAEKLAKLSRNHVQGVFIVYAVVATTYLLIHQERADELFYHIKTFQIEEFIEDDKRELQPIHNQPTDWDIMLETKRQ